MKKGDKLRVIVSKGDDLLEHAPLKKGQLVIFGRSLPGENIEVFDGPMDDSGWWINPKAVEAV